MLFRSDLGFGSDASGQDLHAIGIDGGLVEDLEAREPGKFGEESGLVEADGAPPVLAASGQR